MTKTSVVLINSPKTIATIDELVSYINIYKTF